MTLVKFSKSEHIEELLNGKIKASFAHEFNDPFDSRLYVSEDDISFIAENSKYDPVLIKFYLNMFESTQITSFIKCDPVKFEESILMWAHYAASGKDIAVCYDKSKVECSGSKYAGAWLDVDYDKKVQKSRDFLENYIKDYSNHEKRAASTKDFYSTKYKGWVYEKEFRIISFGFLEIACDDNKETFKK